VTSDRRRAVSAAAKEPRIFVRRTIHVNLNRGRRSQGRNVRHATKRAVGCRRHRAILRRSFAKGFGPLMSVRLIILVASLPFLMGSEIYRYVDANGVVTYAQQLPYGVKGELIRTTPGAPTVTVPPKVEGAEQPTLTQQQQIMLDNMKKTESARKEEIARIREANCTRSQGVLDRLSNSGRVRVKGADGQEVMMSEEERQSRIEEAQRGIVANCNPGDSEEDASQPAVANVGG